MDWPHSVTTPAGVVMPPIVYGTAWKKERTKDFVIQAFAAGFRGFDTACQPKHYDEPLVGQALATCQEQGVARDAFYLQTKFTPLSGQDPERVPYDPSARLELQVQQSLACSLANLQTDYLDGFVLHSPLSHYEDTLRVWRTMESFVQAESVRQLGISNCYDLNLLCKLYEDAEIKPALVQNRFYHDTGYDVALREWCREQGMVYQSFWTLTANPHLLDSNVIQQLARQYGRTPAQILFAYLAQQGVVPLTGTTSPLHMAQDLASFDLQLNELQQMAISQLLL